MYMGRTTKKPGMSIDDYLARSPAGESTKHAYRYILVEAERWVGKPLASASGRDVLELTKRLRGMQSGKQYANILRTFYKAAGREDLRALLLVKQRIKRLGPQDILSVQEVQAIIDGAHTTRDKALIATLWETGVRIHELLALDLGDVQVRESPENGGRVIYVMWFKKTKVPGEEHTGYVIEAAPTLTAWLKAHPRKKPDAPLFVKWGGGRLGPPGADALFKGAAKRAGVTKRVFLHLLRHSRATHLLRLRVPELQVKQLLGWKANSPMLARYAHLAHQDAYDALLRAQGLEPPAPVDLGKLAFPDQDLKPIVPMIAPPGASTTALDDIEMLRAAIESNTAKADELRARLDAFLAAHSNP